MFFVKQKSTRLHNESLKYAKKNVRLNENFVEQLISNGRRKGTTHVRISSWII